MEKFLTRSRVRSQSVPRLGETERQSSPPKMAAAASEDTRGCSQGASETEVGETAPSDYASIVESVAQLPHPNIVKAVEQVLQDSVQEIKRDLRFQAKSITETVQRISDLQDELSQTQAHLATGEIHRPDLIDKIEDLENRSCQNNIRIIGLPESYKPQSLMELTQ